MDEPQLECVPTPRWVEQRTAPTSVAGPSDAYIDNGLLRLLFHSQVCIEDGGFAHNFRTVQRIVTRGGAEKAAQFAVEFAPDTQRVEVHFIRVLRGGELIEHATRSEFHLLRRETKLERLILDGRLTANREVFEKTFNHPPEAVVKVDRDVRTSLWRDGVRGSEGSRRRMAVAAGLQSLHRAAETG